MKLTLSTPSDEQVLSVVLISDTRSRPASNQQLPTMLKVKEARYLKDKNTDSLGWRQVA